MSKGIGAGLGLGLIVVAVATAPIWVPLLFGQKPKSCRCGAEIGPAGVTPYCTCDY